MKPFHRRQTSAAAERQVVHIADLEGVADIVAAARPVGTAVQDVLILAFSERRLIVHALPQV